MTQLEKLKIGQKVVVMVEGKTLAGEVIELDGSDYVVKRSDGKIKTHIRDELGVVG